MVVSQLRIREVLSSGLPRAGEGASVAVIGAGMAGLVAASELLNAGYSVTLLEAQQRVGGRVFTMREPFTDGLHAEAGAMRIPKAHDLTLHYVNKFRLETMPFTMGNPNAWVALLGQKTRLGEFRNERDALHMGLAETELATPIGDLWAATLHPILERLAAGGELAWSEVASELDQFSLWEFLEQNRWSQGAIELFCLVSGMEPFLNSAFMEILREEAGNWFNDVVSIVGGMDRLPKSFMPQLLPHIRFGARVTSVGQDSEGVTIQYQNAAGRNLLRADHAVVTLPFSVLRHIEFSPALSRGKQRAIRQLYYDASTKILLQTRSRFWETNDGIFGGGSVTDMPIRAVYYPDHGRETGRGVLLGSYTWGEDAHRWGSLSPADRIVQAIENVAVIHPEIRDEFEVGASKVWHDDEFAGGAFALFDPGQQTHLYSHIIEQEGRLHFAGEHASLAHAWIQGAIESGLRAAIEISGA